MTQESLLTFPCDFPIKIIGKNESSFKQEITDIIRKHYPLTSDHAITSQESHSGNYLSITATIIALDQASLDALYQDLTAHPNIKMVL